MRRGRRGELRPGVARITEHLGHHAHASHCSSRWSALWAPHTRETRPHHPEPRPHRHQTGGIALHGDPVRDLPADDIATKRGNCTIRGATRRRHAEGRLLMLQNPHHYPWRHAPARVERTRSGGILPMGRIPSEALRRKHASTMTDDASARHRQPHRRREHASATDTSPDDAGTGPRATRCGATFQANREGQPVLKLVVSS